jgi:hypothetical protein
VFGALAAACLPRAPAACRGFPALGSVRCCVIPLSRPTFFAGHRRWCQLLTSSPHPALSVPTCSQVDGQRAHSVHRAAGRLCSFVLLLIAGHFVGCRGLRCSLLLHANCVVVAADCLRAELYDGFASVESQNPLVALSTRHNIRQPLTLLFRSGGAIRGVVRAAGVHHYPSETLFCLLIYVCFLPVCSCQHASCSLACCLSL